VTALPVAVAASGGTDSTALLHCVCRLALRHGLTVHALHVHHGLQPDADAWVGHLRRQVTRWARRGLPVVLHVHRLTGTPGAGESIEAWARRERRSALAAMARDAGCQLVLLAQHRRDQAETVLLQALRGGGARGLAAMPRVAVRDGLSWARPWLDQPRQAVESYLRRHKLRAVVDPSNSEPRFARSRLRATVMPALTHAFADAEVTLAAVARRAAVEAAAIDEWLSRDLPLVAADGQLDVKAWAARHESHRHLLLRRWLADRGLAPVAESLVVRLVRELPRASVGCWPLAIESTTLHLYRGRLSLRRVGPRGRSTPAACAIDLSRAGHHDVPAWGGFLSVQEVRGGLSAGPLREATLCARRGGEQFQSDPGRPPRSLRKQFQAAGISAAERQGPLVYVGDSLVYVPGLGIDARWRAVATVRAAQRGLELQWHTGLTGAPGTGTPGG
jgi:tRNA(Ile)-lysidine synthase